MLMAGALLAPGTGTAQAAGDGIAAGPLSTTPPPLTAAQGGFFHHLLVSVRGRTARVSAIDTAGRVRDRVRVTCGD